MNAVEIFDALSNLASLEFEKEEFPFLFLEAFGNKEITIKRLRSGTTNKSDCGGVLQTNNIHIKTCDKGEVESAIKDLKESKLTNKFKAQFILATDGDMLEAEDLKLGELLACKYSEFNDHFSFFLPLAGISTVKEIRENTFDIKATGILNKLYTDLLKNNPKWSTEDKKSDMNHFMARLIFCFFSEDTDIFPKPDLFTDTVRKMSDTDSLNTHKIIQELFLAMNTNFDERDRVGVAKWAYDFPFVNGGLFAGNLDVPKFSKIARSFLLRVGDLDWQQINPDIFGSMIQAVADENERGELGMHYTSVPNILKVLNPLFLDELKKQLKDAGDNPRKLLNLRNRMSKMRMFDPACGSGNFLVIAYKEIRKIEAEINNRRNEKEKPSVIPITNFRGIEIRDFSAEIARLALIIAEYQCDVLHRGQKEAIKGFLPLKDENWITSGNALRIDWDGVFPSKDKEVKIISEDLLHGLQNTSPMKFVHENESEVFIFGNPPYVGFTWQTHEQKDDMQRIFGLKTKEWKSLDYVCGWVLKAIDYGKRNNAKISFVVTNSVCQGEHVPILWPLVFDFGFKINFAFTSFKWSNLARHKAGVSVVIIGLSTNANPTKQLFAHDDKEELSVREVNNISPYLTAGADLIVSKVTTTPLDRPQMFWGNKPVDGGNLHLTLEEKESLLKEFPQVSKFIKKVIGSTEFIRGKERYCLWIENEDLDEALEIKYVRDCVEKVRNFRLASKAPQTRDSASFSHRFRQIQATANEHTIIMPGVSSEKRYYLPSGLLDQRAIVNNLCFAIYDGPLWCFSVLASRLHLCWVDVICGKHESRFRYSNTLGWNAFPLPKLTSKNQSDLSACAENILLVRESYFPSTVAELYETQNIPSDLKEAHNLNDETLERIYIGRTFKNDSERFEKLINLYEEQLEV
jgi:hypothetical protein